MLAASAIGSAHASRGEPCQDAFAWTRLPGGGACLALADGAGSARHGGLGARVAAAAAVAAGGDPAARVAAARAAVLGLGPPPRELACTLIVVTWNAEGVAAAHVGDGAVVGRRAGDWLLVSGPESGEYVNETRFLTDPAPRVRTSGLAPEIEGVVAFTDGCQRAALGPGGVPFGGFLDPLARHARAAAPDAQGPLCRLLHAPKLRAVTDDDLTLALVWRGPEV